MFVACSDDEDDVRVNNNSVAGCWDYSEVLVDDMWMDAKKAKRTGSLLLTQDGYYSHGWNSCKYKINGNSVELYDEDGKTVLTLIRFSRLDQNSAEITRTTVSSGRSEQIRLVRDTSEDSHLWKSPINYLSGTWTGGREGHEYTITFMGDGVTIEQGDITYTGQYVRYPLFISSISIYNSDSPYWGPRNPDFVINDIHIDTTPQTLKIVGADGGKYSYVAFFVTR